MAGGAGSYASSLAMAALLALAACSHDWDAYAPGPAGPGGNGAAGPGGAGTGGSGAGPGSGGAGATGGAATAGGAGPGSGGAGGEGPPLHCAGTHLLQDDFLDDVLDERWTTSAMSGSATIVEGNGDLTIAIAADSLAASTGQVVSKRRYDLLENRMRFEVVETLAAAAGSALTSTSAYYDGNNSLRFHVAAGKLAFVQRVAGVSTELGSIDHDLITQRHWQLREEGGTVYWETSPDMVTFTVQAQASVASLFDLTHLRVELLAQAKADELSPGQARFASVNDGLPTGGGWCLASTLTDDFEDGAQSVLWGRSFASGGSTKEEVGGQLVLTPAPGASSQAGYFSGTAYDISASSVAVEVPQTTTSGPDTQTFLRVETNGDNGFTIAAQDGTLYWRTEQDGRLQVLDGIPYDAQLHRWWRLRGEGGAMHYETSADGQSWTEHQTTPPGKVDLAEVDVVLSAQAGTLALDPGAAHFDNVNLAP